MVFPVRVVIPTIPSRREFLEKHCLPTVIENDPAEVVVVRGDGGAPEKRNRGATGNTQPYLLFVDDDSRLLSGSLGQMYAAAEITRAAFVYSDFNRRPSGGVFNAGTFSVDRLRRNNYIDTTSLVRAMSFPGFDEKLLRFQDWDLWLTIIGRGGTGMYIRDQTLFEKWKIDDGITEKVPEAEARRVIVEKHGL